MSCLYFSFINENFLLDFKTFGSMLQIYCFFIEHRYVFAYFNIENAQMRQITHGSFIKG